MVPWELLWGPDNRLWMTNNQPRCILRLHPDTKELDTVHVLNALPEHTMALLGLAVHPRFPQESWIYLSYMLQHADGQIGLSVSRFTVENGRLGEQLTIIDNLITKDSWLPGGCLFINQDEHLLVATSNEHGDNTQSRDPNVLNGKILRYNLDGTIPEDNPFPGSPVFTLGHRNPQGISQDADGMVVVCEHGPSTDDEVNALKPGADYGWPDVSGPCDTDQEQSICMNNHIQEPLMAWSPTIAPSSLACYRGNRYSMLANNLLVTTLKEGDLRLMEMKQGKLVGRAIYLDEELGRLRNLAISPEGRVFVCTANQIPENFSFPRPVPKQQLDYDVVAELIFP